MKTWLFTSESVAAGHPDKMADQISDAVLDEVIRQSGREKSASPTFASPARRW